MDKDSHVVKYAVIDPLLNSTSQSTDIPVKVKVCVTSKMGGVGLLSTDNLINLFVWQ